MKKIGYLLLLCASHIAFADQNITPINDAYKMQLDKVQVIGEGIIVKKLNGDKNYAKYIIKTSDSTNILLSYDKNKNIELLKPYDLVSFTGNYSWNVKGGVVNAKSLILKNNSVNIDNSLKNISGKTVNYAFINKLDKVQVQDSGVIIKILPDDLKGIKHQKFLVRVGKQTILIVYNIDIAQRIPGLKVKNTVEFSGEYIFNDKGGLVHWTHHDPRHNHPNGWIKYSGKIYK